MRRVTLVVLALSCLLGASGSELTAQQTTYRVIVPPDLIRLGIPGKCDTLPSRRSQDTTALDTLVLGVAASAKDTATTLAPASVLALLGDQRIEVIQGKKSGEFTSTQKAGVYGGKILTVIRYSDHAFLCSVALPKAVIPSPREAKSAAELSLARLKEAPFSFRTGVEFVSASGFADEDTKIPVTAGWSTSLGIIRDPLFRRPFRASVTAMGERSSVIKSQVFMGCDTLRVTPNRPGPPGPIPICAPGRLLDDTTRLIFRTNPDSTVNVTDPAGTWRVAGLLQFETPLSTANDVFVGPVASIGFETNPVDASGPVGLLSFQRIGFVFREVKEDGTERFNLLALYGDVFHSREQVLKRDPFDPTSEDVIRPFRVEHMDGWLYRVTFQPVKNIYLRGMGQFAPRGPDLAMLAVLTEVDLGKVLEGLGIVKK